METPNQEEELKAIASLNENELEGRVVVVKLANPKAPGEAKPQEGNV